MECSDIVFLDLFSGAGGFPLGFMEAGFSFRTHYFSEIDKYAIANYHYNFKYARYAGTVEKIKARSIQRPDIVTFGFPCQDLSLAGKRHGLNGERSGLFFEALRIITEYKPRVFVFENVKGIFSSNNGKDFEIILKAIADSGLYECEWQLLNTAWFLPQHRHRIYFIGHLRGASRPKVFPFKEDDFPPPPRRAVQVAGTLMASGGQLTNMDNYVVDSLRTHGNARKLTPLEYERLQGFPDNWTRFGVENGERLQLSDTQRYQLMGNAVSVPVVKAIAERLRVGDKVSPTVERVALNLEALELELELFGLDF